MKKLLLVIGSIILFITLFWFIATRPVDNTPFYNTEYYVLSQQRIEEQKKARTIEKGQLYAGFSKVSITPWLNEKEDQIEADRFKQLPLAGYGDRNGDPAIGIHDSIFIKAAAIKAGNNLAVLISADILIVPPDITDSVLFYLAYTDISRNNLFFSATHTHSSLGAWGGGLIGEKFSGEENDNLKKWLTRKMVTAIITAIKDLKPAQISMDNLEASAYTRNRLIGEYGTKNNDFSFIYLEQHGHKSAIVGSYSAHATTLGSDNMEVSADYPGYWARYMEANLADYALFFAGSMGSQSPVSKGDGFEKAEYLGEALAKNLITEMDTNNFSNEILLSSTSLKIPLPPYRFRVTNKRTLTSALTTRLMPHSENAYLQAIRINEMVWITTPADFSGEYALMIKDRLTAQGFKANVTSFNGSYLGYIIPGRYFYLDKYEPKTMGWYGPWMGDYTMELIRQLTDIVAQYE